MATPRACLCGSTTCSHRRRRPSTSHAYGAAHQEAARRLFASSPEICARCGKGPIYGDPWEAGHIQDVARYGPNGNLQREHRSCNRRAGAQLAAQLKREKADARAAARIEETRRLLGITG
jgi:hypothetical protein